MVAMLIFAFVVAVLVSVEVMSTDQLQKQSDTDTGELGDYRGCDDVTKDPRVKIFDKECGHSNISPYNNETAQPGEYPWVVLLDMQFTTPRPSGEGVVVVRGNCSGVVISERHVLAAAHCFRPDALYSNSKDLIRKIEAKVLYLEPTEGCTPFSCLYKQISSPVKNIEVHESYDPETRKNNIALIETVNKFKLSDHLRPVCLPLNCSLQDHRGWILKKTDLTEVGFQIWRKIESNNPVVWPAFPAAIQKIVRHMYKSEVCRSHNNVKPYQQITVSQFCTKTDFWQHACDTADSGAPVFYTQNNTNFLIGLASFAPKCTRFPPSITPGIDTQDPVTFTRVNYFLFWILDKLSE